MKKRQITLATNGHSGGLCLLGSQRGESDGTI